jgi:hypothetical protein
MRRILGWFVMLAACTGVYAQEVIVEIDLGVADPAAARTYAVQAGKTFSLKLINAVPGATYEIVKENRRADTAKAATVATAAACTPAEDQVGRLLKDVKKETEVAASVVEAKKFIATCNDTTEEPNLNTALGAATSVTFTGYKLNAGETMQKTFKREGADQTWAVAIVTQGGSAATTATAAAKAANPIASDSPNLDRLLKNTADSTTLTVGECSYTENTCSAELHINADQISTLTIKDIPKGKVKVTVTAGELFNCRALSYNFAVYDSAPDRLIIPLHMPRGMLGVAGTPMGRAQAEAAKLYGLDFCPGTGEIIDKRRFAALRSDAGYQRETQTRYASQTATERANDPRQQPREEPMQFVPPDTNLFPRGPEPSVPSLPLFLRGRAQVVDVLFEWSDGERKTFSLPVRYQRFWLDAGGFFAFSRHTDQFLESEVVPAISDANGVITTPERRKVTSLRSENSYDPSTGIVINIHPGNAPALALQFGIAANQGRLPSYYLGIGARAREIGKRGLATIAVGVAMQQEATFPQIAVGEIVVPDSTRLQAKQKYGFTFPYVSISLGFSFGGVSERTSVASSVTTSR